MTFAPPKSSPLTRTISPFKDPRTPPSTPGKTAKLWDEYEKRAIENSEKRKACSRVSQPQRSSASDIQCTSTSALASARSSFDFKFRTRTTASSVTPVAICKSCKQPITYTSGICEHCKKTIILSSPSEDVANTISPLSPTVHIPTHPYARHNSATPSELSTLYPYTSRAASVNTGYGLQPATSAWDDWDSDDGEKAGLVGWFAKTAKDKAKKKERSDSKTSMDSVERKLKDVREEEAKKSREQTRRKSPEAEASSKGMKVAKSNGVGRKRPSGFARVFSCGGCSE
ncbi:hypothetical protein EK21DRAFT_97452 [Setomelanomma holmii]|uniref:Uncharacterized protein n=1 Tax=Setomelanomma holmii TaxID=210430 RepID=A0A9P4HGU9_9PLEO|nr:hypothetical protein EK21DRAFT_97452 [Setomelanomma holmii]